MFLLWFSQAVIRWYAIGISEIRTVLMKLVYFVQNTVQSYEYALNLLQQLKEVGVDPVRRVITYAASLALSQNAPNIALEILSLSGVSNYVTVRNLKVEFIHNITRSDLNYSPTN